MQTPLHTRPASTRNLFRANPIERKEEKASKEHHDWLKLKSLINEGHKSFWNSRNVKTPPRVSKTRFMDFDNL